MAEMFYSHWGVKAFYLCTIVYLYGDLCIYAVAVPKSLQSVACGVFNESAHHNGTLHCLGDLDKNHSYSVFLVRGGVLHWVDFHPPDRPFLPPRRSSPPSSAPFASSTRKRQSGCSSSPRSCAGRRSSS